MLYSVEKIVKEPLEIEFGDIEKPSEEVNKILNNLPSVNEISKEKVLIKSDAQTLFIIGNGFDLHHGLYMDPLKLARDFDNFFIT